MTSQAFDVQPISSRTADSLRTLGGTVVTADVSPGFPCRQCLRDAEVGEELILVSHDPFAVDSPYRSASPIFLHAHRCELEFRDDELPEQLTRRQLNVRSFDDAAMMVDAMAIDGSELAATIETMFQDPTSSFLHVHNAPRGCWAVTIGRGRKR